METTTRLSQKLLEELRGILDDRVTTALAVLDQHGTDESFHPSHPPDAVAFPRSTEEVAEIVRLCARHETPMIPFGAGTSLEGQVHALHGGLSIDLAEMNRVLEVNHEDMDCRVEAGLTRKRLNAALHASGLFFPIDPGADASIGGMAATGASGTNAVRYGTMRENVLGLTIVLADGRVIKTGGRARKSSAGYDLTRLMIGSEGTLGVITEIQIRLHGIPEAVSAAVCPFETLDGAVSAVITTIQCGIPVARAELLDDVQMDAVNRYSDFDYPVRPTLFFEFHGTERGVAEQIEGVAEIVAEHGGGDFEWATHPEERSRLWQARHDAYYAALALRPGSQGWATDVCVPISRLAECLLETRADIAEAELVVPIVGHVGDGNFHLVFLVDPERPEELKRAESVNERMVRRALALGGTCTGEHGVGYGKTEFLRAEHGEGVSVMLLVKRALDPLNLMNPGKLF